jgi:hypothetical protein
MMVTGNVPYYSHYFRQWVLWVSKKMLKLSVSAASTSYGSCGDAMPKNNFSDKYKYGYKYSTGEKYIAEWEKKEHR